MPANRGLGSPNWSPQPDFAPHRQMETALDERHFGLYSVEDVAKCLLESDPQLDVYRWSLTEEEINTLAVESAMNIIQQKKELLLRRQLELAKAARTKDKVAVVAGYTENLTTGEVTVYSREVPMGRAFG